MNIFLSHNSADKEIVRALAMLLAGEGINLFFDEWNIRLGDPLMGTIERGIEDANIFMIFWSEAARKSKWVDTEVQTFLRRRIEDPSLKVVPLFIDDTPVPPLLANFAGMNIAEGNPQGNNIETVVQAIIGEERHTDLAKRLQQRLNRLAEEFLGKGDMFGWLVCPACGSENLQRKQMADPAGDEFYFMIDCAECGHGDWTQ